MCHGKNGGIFTKIIERSGQFIGACGNACHNPAVKVYRKPAAKVYRKHGKGCHELAVNVYCKLATKACRKPEVKGCRKFGKRELRARDKACRGLAANACCKLVVKACHKPVACGRKAQGPVLASRATRPRSSQHQPCSKASWVCCAHAMSQAPTQLCSNQ